MRSLILIFFVLVISARVIDRYTGRKEAVVEDVLSPWSIYEFRVAAINDRGYGPFSAPSPQYSTKTASPHKAPANVGGGGGKIGDLTISWTVRRLYLLFYKERELYSHVVIFLQPLPPQDQNAPGIYYKIFWRRQGTHREYEFQELKEYGNVGYAVVRIPKEYYYTKYEVKVQAINDIGKGPESPVTVIYSAEDMPQVAPQFVASLSYNSTALNVTWSPISEERELVRGKLIGYRVGIHQYHPNGNEGGLWSYDF